MPHETPNPEAASPEAAQAVPDLPVLTFEPGSPLPESTLIQDSAPARTPIAPVRTNRDLPAAAQPDETMQRGAPVAEQTQAAANQPSMAYDPAQTDLRSPMAGETMLHSDLALPEPTQAVSDLHIHATSAGAPTIRTLARATKLTVPGYEIIESVGKGGMGVVYRARQTALDRDIAIKFLREDYHPKSNTGLRFLEEAKITAQLQHPGIPAVHEVGHLADGRPFLVMKLIRGRTLDALLKEQGPGSTLWLPVFEAICQAVGFAHVHGVIHRDLKPANIMVGAFGEVQVMDWGLAKVLGRESIELPNDEPTPNLSGVEISSIRSSESLETRAGSYLGTPAYMAAEQAAGTLELLGPRTDVFGLGALLCTLMTGKPPYVGGSAEATRLLAAAAKLDDAIARLDASGADPDLIDLCKRCLAADPKARPADGSVVARQVASLRAFAEERARQAELDRAKTEIEIAEQRKRRKVKMYAAGGIAAALVAGIIGVSISYFNEVKAKEEETKAKDLEKTAKSLADQKRIEAEDATAKAQAAEKIAREQRAISDSTLAFFLKDLLRQADAEAQADALLQSGGGFQATENPTIRELLDRAAEQLTPEKIERRFPNQLAVQASILKVVGQTYRGIGANRKAIAFLKRAFDTYKAATGPDSRETLDAQNLLAVSYQAAGRTREAVYQFERLREASLAKYAYFGPTHGNTLNTTNNLALAYLLDNRVAEAVRLLEETRRAFIDNKKWDADDEVILTVTVNLARAYHAAGRLAEAIDLLEDVRRIRADTLGLDHTQTLATKKFLADCLLDVGEKAHDQEALALYQNVLEAFRRIFGPDHPDTLTAENNLADALRKLGMPQKALPLFEHRLAALKARYGDDHPDTITALNNLAAMFPDRVIELYTQAARGVVRLRYDHPHAREIFRNLAAALEAKNRYREAEPWWRNWQIAIKQEEPEGMNSAAYATSCAVLGRNLLFQKKWDDAIASLRESLALREKLQPGLWSTYNIQSILGGALHGAGRHDEAQKLLEEGFEGMMMNAAKIPDEARYNLFDAGVRLWNLYRAMNQAEKADALLKRLPREIAPKPKGRP